MVEDLHNPLIKTVAVLKRILQERVAIIAISADLRIKYIVRDVPGDMHKQLIKGFLRQVPNPHLDTAYHPLQIYANELEQRLLDSQQQIQWVNTLSRNSSGRQD